MNIELKPIAESKVRQLGGDVCGVLVRDGDGTAMAVSEHGRCTRLDAGVMGPVDGAQGGEWLIQMRGEYLKTRGVWERPDHRGYTNDINEAGRYTEEEARKAEQMMPEKCKAVRLPTARAQGGQGAEVVACPLCKYERGHQIGCENNPVDMALRSSAQPQPAVPEWVHDLRKAAEGATPGPWHGGHGASPLTACVDWRDDDGNMTSDCFVKTGGHAKVVCKAEPRSWRGVLQASKDIAFISAANPAAVLELLSLLSTPTTPQADGWVRCEDRVHAKCGGRVIGRMRDGDSVSCEKCGRTGHVLIDDGGIDIDWTPAGQEGDTQ